MFNTLEKINSRPKPFQYYTAEELWSDGHTSRQMLAFHLNESIDVSSRNKIFIEKSVSWISKIKDLGANTSVCDFGCGPGLYTALLAETGADVTGIDFSPRSIAYAKRNAEEKGLNIEYVMKNYLDYDTDKRFDLIIMIMCDFCALSPEQRKILLDKFNTLLKDNGSVLLDVYSLTAYDRREEQTLFGLNLLDGFWSPDKYYGFQNTYKYDEEKVILDKYTIIERSRVRTIYNWLQYFSRQSLISEFESYNFQIGRIYSDVAGRTYDHNSDEIAILAHKAA